MISFTQNTNVSVSHFSDLFYLNQAQNNDQPPQNFKKNNRQNVCGDRELNDVRRRRRLT